MKKIIIIFILQFLFVYSYSQDLFSIKGTLKCDTTFVKNTTVKLFKDSIPIRATITNENGIFIFEKLEKGSYKVEAISVFYEPVSINVNLFNNSDLGIIKISELSILLNEVEIKAGEEPVILTDEGVVLNVAGTVLRDKGNVLDLLNFAPVTFIAANASQFESGGLEILVNGKKLNIPVGQQDNFLKSIPSQNIVRIEITDKPDASVAGNQYGKINIIMKQNKGLSGDLEAKSGYHKTFTQNITGSLFYNSEKIRLYSLLDIDIRKWLSEESGIENRNDLAVDKSSEISSDCRTSNFILGADYQINKKSSIGFLYSIYHENNKEIKSIDKYIFSADYLVNDSLICKEENSNSKYILQTFTLNYYLTTDSLGSNFSTSVDFAPTIQNGYSLYDYSFWKSSNDTIPIQIINNKYEIIYKNNILSYSARYDHNFKNSSSLNFGTKLSYTDYNNGWDAFKLINQDYNYDGNNSKKITFNENIAALFSGYKFQYRKSYFSISIRGEYNLNKYKNNNDDLSTVANWVILPTFLHNITINDENKIYYYFTEKIYRPNFNYYMESSVFDPISQTYGNSKLEPQNQYVFALGYVLKNKYSFTLQALRNDNLFLNLPEISENQLIYNRINGGLIHSAGLFLNVPINIFEWWETNTNISGRFININFKEKNYNLNSLQGNFSHTSTFILPKGISLFFDYSYRSKSKSFFVEQSGVHDLGAGVGWRINNKFWFGFSVSDILNSTATHTNYNYYDVVYGNTTVKEITSRVFWLRLSYSFSVGKEIEDFSTRESGIEEQKGRIH